MSEVASRFRMTHIVVGLPDENYTRLRELVDRGTLKKLSGGYQYRLRKWDAAMNDTRRTIMLDEDDCAFIQRQMANSQGGGFQSHISKVFDDTHRFFAGAI